MPGSRQVDYIVEGAVKLHHWEPGGGGGLKADRRQAEDDRHRYHSGSNVGSTEASFSRKAPDKLQTSAGDSWNPWQMLMAEKVKTRELQLENERLQNTLEVYKKALKEKSEEIESKNETINQMIEERVAAGEDLGLDDIDVGQLLDVNLGAAHIRDLLEDRTLLNCDLLDSPGREVESFNAKVGIEQSSGGRPGVVGRLKVQRMEKMGFLPQQNLEDCDVNQDRNADQARDQKNVGHQVNRNQGKSKMSQVSNHKQEETRSNSETSQEQRQKQGRKSGSRKQSILQPLAFTPSRHSAFSPSRNSFNGSPATSSSSETSPTPPVKKLKSMTSPPAQNSALPLTRKQKLKAKPSSSGNTSLCTQPQNNKLKIGVMSTRVGTIKKYSNTTSTQNKSDYNSASDVNLKSSAVVIGQVQNNAVSATNLTSSSTTVVCPHCPKQFPRGGAWKIPQHISSAHPSSSPHLAPQISSSPPSTNSSVGLPSTQVQGKSFSSRGAVNQMKKGNPSPPSAPLSMKCKQCGENLPYCSTQVAHRALHSALPPWQCLGCKLPLPSLHIFLDHVRGSHKVTSLQQAEYLLAPLEE